MCECVNVASAARVAVQTITPQGSRTAAKTVRHDRAKIRGDALVAVCVCKH